MTASPTGPEGPQPAPAAQSLRGQATSGVMWAAAEKWMVRGSTLVGFVILGRLLSPEEFGIVALAMVFITLLTVVTDSGLTAYLVQRRTLDRAVTSTAFYVSAAVGLILSPALAFAAPALADLFDVPALGQVLPALAVALLIASLSNVPAGLLQRELRFKELAVRQVLATGLSVVVAIGLAFAGAGVWALVGQTLVRGVVSFVVLWWTSDFRPAWTFSRAAGREMLGFGSKTMLVRIFRHSRDEGESLLIGVLLGTTVLGLWTVALRLVNVIMDLGAAVFGRVAHPVFAKLRDDSPRLGRALGNSMAIGGLVLVPSLVVLAMTSDVVVPAVFGEQWVPATGVAAILAFRAIGYGLGEFHRALFLATGRPGVELAIMAVEITVQIGLIILLADRGLTTVAVALTAWVLLLWPVRAIAVRHLDGIGWRTYTQTWLVLLAAGLAVGAVLVTNQVVDLDGWPFVALTVLLGGVVYVGAAMLVCRPTVQQAVAAVPARLRPARRGKGRDRSRGRQDGGQGAAPEDQQVDP
ncbi:lipopolysaccharide biosynthesis protein [Actinotalea sp. BY-33]|uniref:Lipopolysaccharide biosynthesis protein n=1 Tax=Actinotalea soli TaxID=2819234 RepID=A0A939LWR0_9CELL|nr:lipopolysaccharide biosynthesis protein [Actinotalea soli]MBO1752657.1 lipopolysaccharide biosynthesis protein [Actinotalea soli]